MGQALVLVVDDDPDIRDSLEDILRADGYEAAVAGSGAEALRILSECRVGLVLLDFMMPVMDGREVVEEMRRRRIDVPVILLSAGREITRLSDELDIPALRKPFELEELLREVRRSLRHEDFKAPISG